MSKWRRITAWCVIVSHLTASLSWAQDHTPDLNKAREQLEVLRALSTGSAGEYVDNYKTYDIPTAEDLYRKGLTQGDHAAANSQRITECRLAEESNYKGMAPQQRRECQSVLTAAGVLRKPNPYFDSEGKNLSGVLQREADMAREKARGEVQAGNVASPTTLSTQVDCGEASAPLPPIDREDLCSIDKPSDGQTCDIPVSITVKDKTVSTVRNESACQPYEKNKYCEYGEEQCTAYTQVNVAPEGEEPEYVTVCSQYIRGYTCWRPNDPWIVYWPCKRLDADANCRFTHEEPLKYQADKVVLAHRHYQCKFTPPATVPTGSNCSTKVCVGDTCTLTPAASNPDFANAMVGMEVLRQGGIYACDRSREECVDDSRAPEDQNIKLFSGVINTCKDPIIGNNCCSSSDGDSLKTNRSVLPSVTDVIIDNALGNTQLASNYVYDFMFTKGGDWLMDKAIDAWSSGAWDPGAGFNLKLSLYGFSLGYGSGGGGVGFLTNMLGGDNIISQGLNLFGDGGNIFTIAENIAGIEGLNLTFNPYMLALQLAIYVISQLMSCTIDEKMLAMRRGGDLCVKMRRYCAKRLPIVRLCIIYAEDWCCWNSHLAKLIGTHGAAQIGLGGKRCGGLTPEEVSKIDFSKLPLDQVMNEIMNTAKLPDGTFLSETMMHGNRRRADAAVSLDPDGVAIQAGDPDLVDYTAGRLKSMMNR